MLPTKPIEKATVYFAGDRSVGIPSASFELEMYLDLNCFGDKLEALNEARAAIMTAYELLQGEPPSWVMFDFEIAEENRREREIEFVG